MLKDIPTPILIGYLPKKTPSRNAWFDGSVVQEVCSVSDCMSKRPDDWIDHWKHNAWGLYDSESLAWEIVGNDRKYDLYALRLFPVVFDGPEILPITIVSSANENLAGYDLLGYDPVGRLDGAMMVFDHSPLSCNQGFQEYQVNRYCLIDERVEAWRITKEIARAAKEHGSWEPGPYCLCEVYRLQRS